MGGWAEGPCDRNYPVTIICSWFFEFADDTYVRNSYLVDR